MMPDNTLYKIKDVRRFGAICFIETTTHNETVKFAWQIHQDKTLLSGFSEAEKNYLEKIAHLEDTNEWYQNIGELLFKHLGEKNNSKNEDINPDRT